VSTTFEVLPGLPPCGEPAIAFSGTGHGLHSEGLVVRFGTDGREHWIGNFARGLTSFDCVLPHPNGSDILVIAGGQLYQVEPTMRHVAPQTSAAIVDAFSYSPSNAVVLNSQELWFEAIGPSGRLWKTRRISWDGMRSISVEGNMLRGEAWHFDGTWHPFQLDLNSGFVHGGSHDESQFQARAT
jgi:hypothetical protein